MSAKVEQVWPGGRVDVDLWVRRGCALIVAAVAAYSSFEHQRGFALHGGADATNAALWPLSVDGLLLLATVGLLKPAAQQSRRMRTAVWLAFLGCIAVSLAANVAAAPRLAWQPILVAGWPPVALLLAVELLAHRARPRYSETQPAASPAEPSAPVVSAETADAGETQDETGRVLALAEVSPATEREGGEPTAQEIMWAHVVKERERGRVPTGAELDRVAGTNNYGRTVLRQWREQGRLPAVNGSTQHVRGVSDGHPRHHAGHRAAAGADTHRQPDHIAALIDEYAETAQATDNADLMILLFQLRVVLGDDPAEAGRRISRTRMSPT